MTTGEGPGSALGTPHIIVGMGMGMGHHISLPISHLGCKLQHGKVPPGPLGLGQQQLIHIPTLLSNLPWQGRAHNRYC